MPDPKPSPPESEGSFETSLDKLEDIVAQLEAGAKPLDESLALYEQGIAALKRCHAVLDKAEKRIKLLVKNAAGELTVEDAQRAPADESPAPPADVSPARPKNAKRPKDAPGSGAEKSTQTVDSGPASPQNPATSNQVKRTTDVTPDAGGSLFGNTR